MQHCNQSYLQVVPGDVDAFLPGLLPLSISIEGGSAALWPSPSLVLAALKCIFMNFRGNGFIWLSKYGVFFLLISEKTSLQMAEWFSSNNRFYFIFPGKRLIWQKVTTPFPKRNQFFLEKSCSKIMKRCVSSTFSNKQASTLQQKMSIRIKKWLPSYRSLKLDGKKRAVLLSPFWLKQYFRVDCACLIAFQKASSVIMQV